MDIVVSRTTAVLDVSQIIPMFKTAFLEGAKKRLIHSDFYPTDLGQSKTGMWTGVLVLRREEQKNTKTRRYRNKVL